MSDKVFKILRFWAEVGFAAVGAAYLGLSEVWSLPYGNEVSKTCLIVATLVGAFVGVSRIAYNNKKQG